MTPDDVTAARQAAYRVARARGLQEADAEDVAQTVAVRLLARAYDRCNPIRIGAACARNALVDLHRDSRAVPLRGLDVAIDVACEPDVVTDLARARQHVQRAMDGLDDTDREALELTIMSGRSRPSAARRLGVSTTAMRWRVDRARRALRPMLAHLEEA